MISVSLAKLPIPKLMRWGASDVHFVRPVHTVTLLLDDKVIPANILGIQSDRVIRHRFMGEPEFTIDHADQYPDILRERGKVLRITNNVKPKLKPTRKRRRKLADNADLKESLLKVQLALWNADMLTMKF